MRNDYQGRSLWRSVYPILLVISQRLAYFSHAENIAFILNEKK